MEEKRKIFVTISQMEQILSHTSILPKSKGKTPDGKRILFVSEDEFEALIKTRIIPPVAEVARENFS